MTRNGTDEDWRPSDYVRAEGRSNIGGGAKIIQAGASEKTILAAFLVSSVLAIVAIIYAANANTTASRANDRASIAERESRLAQEDLTLLRAKVSAAGIPVESAGDHQ